MDPVLVPPVEDEIDTNYFGNAREPAMEAYEIVDTPDERHAEDEEEEEEDEEKEPPQTLEDALHEIKLLLQSRKGLERTLRARGKEIHELKAQVRQPAPSRSQLLSRLPFHRPIRTLLPSSSTPAPTAEPSESSQVQLNIQDMKDAFASLMRDHEDLHIRYGQAQDVMFQCSQQEEDAKEKLKNSECIQELLNEELASARQRCDEMTKSCQTLRVTCGDLEAKLREVEEEREQRVAREVDERCRAKLASSQQLHATDMMALENRKQELLVLVDSQKDKIGELEHALLSRSISPQRQRSSASPSRTIEISDEETGGSHGTPKTRSQSADAQETDERQDIFTQSVPVGRLQRPNSFPAVKFRGFSFMRRSSETSAEQPSQSIKNRLLGVRESMTGRLKELATADGSGSPNDGIPQPKPPPSVFGMCHLPKSINRQWTPHTCELTTAQFSPRGTYLATGGSDGVLKLWEEGSIEFTLHRQLTGCTQGICQVDFDMDESCVAAASNDKSVHVWPLSTLGTGGGKHEVLNHAGKVYSARFLNGDSSKLVSSSMDRNIRVWDISKGQCAWRQPVASTCVDILSPSSDLSSPIVSGHMNGKLQVWDHRLQSTTEIMDFGGKLNSLALSPDHRHVACLVNQRDIYVLDLRRREKLFSLSADGFSASRQQSRAIYSSDGSYIACGGTSLFVWSANTGELLNTVEVNTRSPMFACAWYPSGGAFLTAHPTGASVWNC